MIGLFFLTSHNTDKRMSILATILNSCRSRRAAPKSSYSSLYGVGRKKKKI